MSSSANSQRETWLHINDQLDAQNSGRFLRFMNVGFVGDVDEPAAAPTLPPSFPNRASAELLFQVLQGIELSGQRLVEFGCGRGGNLALLDRYRDCSSLVGIDLADNALSFCQRRRTERQHFVQADAQRPALRSGSMDVALSLESACLYPEIATFFAEVRRVLVDRGRFAYADIVWESRIAAYLELLTTLGFTITDFRDITSNVLRARSAHGARQFKALGELEQGQVMEDAFIVPGSPSFELLRDGSLRYLSLQCVAAFAPSQPTARLLEGVQRGPFEDFLLTEPLGGSETSTPVVSGESPTLGVE